MSERETYPPGVPCWVDIAHPDPDAAMRFYGELFGWDYSDPDEIPGGGRYFAARLRGRDVAGISSQPGGGAGSRPVWKTYVLVDSADATTARAKQAGGSAVAEPFDAPPAASPCSPTRRAPCSASGSRRRAQAPSSSTSPAPGA